MYIEPLLNLNVCWLLVRDFYKQGAALSKKQASLRSNVTASGSAQGTDDTAAWDAEPTY